MDREVCEVHPGPVTFGTLTVRGGRVDVIPPKRKWREGIREWLQDAYLIIKVIGGAIGIGLGIREFLSKLKPLGARPRPATCSLPSTQKGIPA